MQIVIKVFKTSERLSLENQKLIRKLKATYGYNLLQASKEAKALIDPVEFIQYRNISKEAAATLKRKELNEIAFDCAGGKDYEVVLN